MKRFLIVMVLSVLIAEPAMALSIANSKHDMIAKGFANGNGSTEVCVFCHTPHGSQGVVLGAPLWNNTAATSVDATLYTSATTNFTTTQGAINATDARLCLACHDLPGVTLPDNQPNGIIMDFTGSIAMSANALLGTNMQNDHPVGIDLGANPELTDMRDGISGMNSFATIKTNFGGNDPFPGDLGDDAVNVIWCSTCHEVHDNVNAPFLRKDNTGSALCKACHKK